MSGTGAHVSGSLTSIAMLPTHRPPPPGEMLLEELLNPLDVSQVEAYMRLHQWQDAREGDRAKIAQSAERLLEQM